MVVPPQTVISRQIFKQFLDELYNLELLYLFHNNLTLEKHKIGGFRTFFGIIQIGTKKIDIIQKREHWNSLNQDIDLFQKRPHSPAHFVKFFMNKVIMCNRSYSITTNVCQV